MPDFDRDGLIGAWLFDGAGGARRLGFDELRAGPYATPAAVPDLPWRN